MMQHALKLYGCLHPADVGADIIRPRATDSRPYKSFCYFFDFCNSPLKKYGL